MKPVYIIGHKNPDLDSVASAIGYQAYKQASGEGLFQAAVAGELSDEAVYVLDALGFEKPLWLKSVANTVEDLLDDQPLPHVHPETSLVELSRMMREQKIKTVPVLDQAGKFWVCSLSATWP
jgi:Inorganic pyrophosphatase/exopolyphosphatase